MVQPVVAVVAVQQHLLQRRVLTRRSRRPPITGVFPGSGSLRDDATAPAPSAWTLASDVSPISGLVPGRFGRGASSPAGLCLADHRPPARNSATGPAAPTRSRRPRVPRRKPRQCTTDGRWRTAGRIGHMMPLSGPRRNTCRKRVVLITERPVRAGCRASTGGRPAASTRLFERRGYSRHGSPSANCPMSTHSRHPSQRWTSTHASTDPSTLDFEDPGTVPASANGRGYASSGPWLDEAWLGATERVPGHDQCA